MELNTAVIKFREDGQVNTIDLAAPFTAQLDAQIVNAITDLKAKGLVQIIRVTLRDASGDEFAYDYGPDNRVVQLWKNGQALYK